MDENQNPLTERTRGKQKQGEITRDKWTINVKGGLKPTPRPAKVANKDAHDQKAVCQIHLI